MINKDQMENILSKIDMKGLKDCWEWKGAKNPKGYGNARVNGKDVRPHRLVFEIATGITIPDGLVAMHLCDNPSCCNPSHIVLGTVKANAADMLIKGREYREGKARGESNGNSRLKQEDIQKIFDYSRGGMPQSHIADIFGVTQTTISRVILRQTWRHVDA